ncbi:MAG: tRNA pseudouridine(55) synthase TruB [Erysipelotrichia bacterium]|nr:tRNA pseudouridine(55) synthase TruB [Erysipelotrichia bacterium]NCC55103.1 tRNA pseudouridine(55) synthase TruB [Erysipelotrichia bacterium]
MNGILIVNKEAGMTSHDVVFKLRKILKTKKIGHSGTLDPNATGVLVVLVGKATKILPFIEDIDKEYIATLKLGEKTLSDDIWDQVLATKEVVPIKDFPSLLSSFKGKIKQLPPMISSIKINGKKLYEYARNNEFVERPLRDVEIYEIACLDEEALKFRVHCSSGTYIRSLCVDIAEKSGNLGCMSSLVRSKVGRFNLADAYTLDEIAQGNYQLHPIYEMLSHYEMIEYMPIEDIKNGKKVNINSIHDEVVITHQKEVIAIYKRHHDHIFACVRGLY